MADDEFLVTADIIGQLSSMGFISVGPATTGSQAVRLARTSHPDMAILDIRMPDGDGLSAARTLFDELLIPCVIVSAYSDPATIDLAKNAGVFAYLVKPPTSGQLLASIQIAWARYQQLVSERTVSTAAEQQLEERKFIERAKWILVKKAGVDEPEAMRMLQKHARDHRERLIDVARRVIRAGSPGKVIDPRPDAPPPGAPSG